MHVCVLHPQGSDIRITTSDLSFSGVGKLDADGLGYGAETGPGAPVQTVTEDDMEWSGAGASHGGQGSLPTCINKANQQGALYCQAGYHATR